MSDSFVHLHNHTEFSLLDGASKINEVVQAAVLDEQPALGITDHGSMYGVLDFYKECQKQGIKPIIGNELYQAEESRFSRPKRKGKMDDQGGEENEEGEKVYYHITALAENNKGYHNLIQLSSRAFLEGYYYKPRVDWDLLAEHSEGLIVTTGCLSGHVLSHLKKDDFDGALAKAARLQDIFGRDNLFVEIQNHGIEDQRRTYDYLLRIAKVLDAPLLATNDSHYVHKENAIAHDALLCQPAGTLVTLSDGTLVPIEKIKAGDIVQSWSADQRRGKLVKESKVTQVGSRNYNGDLITVKTPSGAESSYTSEHICVARMDSSLHEGNYVTYLMRRGDCYRIGSTQFQRQRSKNRPIGGVLGPVARCKEQLADAVWILGVHTNKWEAREEEYFLSHLFNIPTWSFANTRSPSMSPRTPYYVNLWNKIDKVKLRKQSELLLSAFGRLIQYPIWDSETTPLGQRRPMFIRACNLMSGMTVCEPNQITTGRRLTNHGSGAWQEITVSRSPYNDVVYSIEVENTHTYIADGIVTHNCVQTGAMLSDENRFRFDAHEHYIKSAEEMRYLFREQKDACDNTLWIAERSNVEIEFGEVELPDFPLPEGVRNSVEYLRQLSYEGARERWGSIPDHVKERLDYELTTIENMGFSSYFLIVWDLIRYAKESNIRCGPGRGSAAGCLVAYCLKITDIDPIKYDLLFERFLNPSRVSMPDIDMDFDSRYRDEMIRYTARRYGKDKVAQIITFGSIKSRAAVRDASRVMGKPFLTGDKIAKAMPPLMVGRETPLWAVTADSPPMDHVEGWHKAGELRKMIKDDPEVSEIVKVALGLEGLRRSDGIHAAAVVITKDPLTDYVPIQRKPEPGQDPEDAPIVTQYEMHGVEDLGLLKMDFLALRNLDVIEMTLDLIKKTQGIDLDIDNIPLDDEATFRLLQRGDTIGVFQLESIQMRELLRRLSPTEFADVAAVIALYRPGPMGHNMHNDYADRKNGRQVVQPFHPDVEETLSETYGLMIYQESMMRVSEKLAGYSLAEADNLRKAAGKKIREMMAQERDKFVNGCTRNGYDERLGHQVFDIIEPFADYAFNKSHAYAYGLISYQTAYLKANYPSEYIAAVLTSFKDKSERAAVYLAEARRMGLTVTVPDVNKSTSDFTVNDGIILFGMGGIRNVGEGVVAKIITARQSGEFKNFYDFCKRVDQTVLNKKTLEALIKAGAFDSLEVPRKGLAEVFDKVVADVKKKAKNAEKGVMSLFEDEDINETWDIPDIEYDKKERLSLEKEMLGLYISDHPLMGIEYSLQQHCDGTLSDIGDLEDGSIKTFGGVITNLNRKRTKKGDLMATFSLEDLESSVEVIVFPKTMVEYEELIQEDAVITVKGRIDRRDDQIKLIMMDMNIFTGASSVMPVRIRVDQGYLTNEFIDDLKSVLKRNKGSAPAVIHTDDRIVELPEDWSVDPSKRLFDDLKKLFSTTD